MRANASIEIFDSATLTGVVNCWRTPPAQCPVEPLPAIFSRSSTSAFTPCCARW